MKSVIFFLLTGLVIFACKDDDPISQDCSKVVNPMEEIGWLVELKNSFTNCTCDVSIFQATFEDETVYFSMMNDPLCNGIFGVILYDCNKNPVKTYGQDDYDIYASEIENLKRLYTCSDSQ